MSPGQNPNIHSRLKGVYNEREHGVDVRCRKGTCTPHEKALSVMGYKGGVFKAVFVMEIPKNKLKVPKCTMINLKQVF
jgi:hypothetical protein